MQYETTIDIDKPIDVVVHAFHDPEAIKNWQAGLQELKPLGGEQGKPGAHMELHYENENGRKIVLVEEIIENDLPRIFKAVYTTKGVRNVSEHRFEKLDENRTRWLQNDDFQMSGIMWLMGLFMGGAIRKQSRDTQQAFKTYVESL